VLVVFRAGCVRFADEQTVVTVTVATVDVTTTTLFVVIGRELVVVLYVRFFKNGSQPSVVHGVALVPLSELIEASGCFKARRRL
jgi:hypothetical protein